MRWETLRTTAGPAALPLDLPRETVPRGSGRAGLAVPGPEPIEPGTDEQLAIEIRAKSIINRVPNESHMAFKWTINPYRGCSHACVYCLAGETPVLLADGSTKPLADIRPGDRVYGTERDAAGHRRFVVTSVLDHWSTVKRAYRVELADGTVLVASGDHRFLTDKGWKHVSGTDYGRTRRPHLTTRNELVGFGHVPAGPEGSPDYRDGYLAAYLRSDREPTGPAVEIGPRRRIRQYLFDTHLPAPVTPAVGVAASQLVTLTVRDPIAAAMAAHPAGSALPSRSRRPDPTRSTPAGPPYAARADSPGPSHTGSPGPARTCSPGSAPVGPVVSAGASVPGSARVGPSGTAVSACSAGSTRPGASGSGDSAAPGPPDPPPAASATGPGGSAAGVRLSLEWCKGYLAGMFDADGSFRGGVLRIAVEPVRRAWVSAALTRLGYAHVLELATTANGTRTLRLAGGVRESVRFLHTVAPASEVRRSLEGVVAAADARLGVVSVRPLGVEMPMYDITTGTGDFIADGVVSHNCFARRTHTYLDFDAGNDFDTKIVVKVNAGELARKELGSPRWRGESIAMGTNTDPYQRAEGRYRLMREIIAALRDHANPFSILTKGTLILRDLDLITQAAERAKVSVAVSVGSVDERLWRSVEPGTPSPARRLDVVRRFADAGIGCSVLMAPVLPGLSDSAEQLEHTVAAITAAGASTITPLVLHLRPGAREWYREWLQREHPKLVPMYDGMYRAGSYAPKAYQRTISAQVRALAQRYGLPETDRSTFRQGAEPAHEEAPARQPEQLTFGP